MRARVDTSLVSNGMRKKAMLILLILLGVVGVVGVYFFAGSVKEASGIRWGVNFSAKHAAALGLDWRAVYTALLDDLQARRVKISLDWDALEPRQGEFFFEDADWQIAQAKKRDTQLTLVIGMKTMRWPECHVPAWANSLSKKEQQVAVLELLEAIVTRYKNSPSVYRWQVENEPLFPFGDCPWRDRRFLEKEVALVKSLDPTHPVVVSDSGEFSLWFQGARIGDLVSTTMYRRVWFHEIKRYVKYPLPPVFYARKAQLIKTLFGKEVIGGEVQAEPWGPGKSLANTSLREQDADFGMAEFRANVQFAKQTGFSEFYLWGAEWWFWRKHVARDETFWQEARKVFESL